MVAAVSCDHDLNQENTPLWCAVFIVIAGNGTDITLHVRGGHFQNPCLGRILAIPTKYDKLLQSANHMAQGPSPTRLYAPPSLYPRWFRPVLMTVTSTMAILQIMGHDRRYRDPRKHAPLHEQ